MSQTAKTKVCDNNQLHILVAAQLMYCNDKVDITETETVAVAAFDNKRNACLRLVITTHRDDILQLLCNGAGRLVARLIYNIYFELNVYFCLKLNCWLN